MKREESGGEEGKGCKVIGCTVHAHIHESEILQVPKHCMAMVCVVTVTILTTLAGSQYS